MCGSRSACSLRRNVKGFFKFPGGAHLQFQSPAASKHDKSGPRLRRTGDKPRRMRTHPASTRSTCPAEPPETRDEPARALRATSRRTAPNRYAAISNRFSARFESPAHLRRTTSAPVSIDYYPATNQHTGRDDPAHSCNVTTPQPHRTSTRPDRHNPSTDSAQQGSRTQPRRDRFDAGDARQRCDRRLPRSAQFSILDGILP
jgi:hypothetical protein